MKKKPTRGSWIITLPLAGIAIAFLTLIFLPEQRRIDALRHEMRAKQDYVLAAGQMAARLNSLNADLKETLAYSAAWRGRAVESAGATALCGRIAQLAQGAGVTTARFAPGPPRQLDRMARVPLSVVCYGSFAQLQDFLAGLEAGPQRLWLNDLKLEADAEPGRNVRCEMTVEVFVDDSENSD